MLVSSCAMPGGAARTHTMLPVALRAELDARARASDTSETARGVRDMSHSQIARSNAGLAYATSTSTSATWTCAKVYSCRILTGAITPAEPGKRMRGS